MTRRIISIVLSLVMCSLAQPASAIPIPIADVPAMVRISDEIVVGRASLTGNALAPFLISVDRVLKGADAGPRLVVTLDPTAPGPSLQERQYGIFFLRRQSGGRPYILTDSLHPALPASPLPLNRPRQADAVAGIINELIAVLTTPAAALVDPVSGVQSPVAALPAGQAQQVYHAAASAIQSIPYAAAGPALNALAGSNQYLPGCGRCTACS